LAKPEPKDIERLAKPEPKHIEAVWRAESGRVLATLIRLLRDFDRAEEALHDAFLAAHEQWPKTGMPANPRAWLVSAGRFKAIDRIRRRAKFADIAREILLTEEEAQMPQDVEPIADDTLRLIFTCCHPEIPADGRIALTLREVAGLTTEEIAAAFLSKTTAIAQRIVRAKSRIKELALPYEVPEPDQLAERLDTVLHVIYLIFNEGYSASHGAAAIRTELCAEAIRLCRQLVELRPEPDALGLLALMLLQDARRLARIGPGGDIVLLADQDRSRWDRAQIAEGVALVRRAFAQQPVSAYTIEAAIASVHCDAPAADDTDWAEIAALYDLLLRADPSPVVELNRAVAIAMRDGPEAGLKLIEALLGRGELSRFRYAHSAKADLLRRLGRSEEARSAYAAALEFTEQEAERRFIEGRIRGLAN
jgi:RNA polymerase sigma-70 factor (ECF subfamily)